MLTGELGRPAARGRRRICAVAPGCRAELVEAAAAHTALAAARRTLPSRSGRRGLVLGAADRGRPCRRCRCGPPAAGGAGLVAGAWSRRRPSVGLALGGVAVSGHWPGGRCGTSGGHRGRRRG